MLMRTLVLPVRCRRLTHDGVGAVGGGRAGGGAVVVGRASAAAAASAAAPARSVEAGHGRKAGADVCRRVRGVALQQNHRKDMTARPGTEGLGSQRRSTPEAQQLFKPRLDKISSRSPHSKLIGTT